MYKDNKDTKKLNVLLLVAAFVIGLGSAQSWSSWEKKGTRKGVSGAGAQGMEEPYMMGETGEVTMMETPGFAGTEEDVEFGEMEMPEERKYKGMPMMKMGAQPSRKMKEKKEKEEPKKMHKKHAEPKKHKEKKSRA